MPAALLSSSQPGQASQAAGGLHRALGSIGHWSDRLLAERGIPVLDTSFVAVGGGLGSFAMVDYLRICGVPSSAIKVLTTLEHPWQNYQYLASASQITLQGRLRSDSASTPDNIWGFPSYAFREAFAARSVRGFLAPLWTVLTEDILCDYWTPTAAQLFRGIQREADRIDYWPAVARGQVSLVHKRDGGGYFALFTPLGPGATPVAYRSRFVHLAVGYPGLRLLEDLQRYRELYTDHHRVVNAYEPHDHVYEELVSRGGTVVVRGGGIVASRVLDRLITDRDAHASPITILHVLRTWVRGPHGTSLFMRRRGGDGWAFQGFNWPKSTWGGHDKARLERLEGDERAQYLKAMGGTTTARRKRWMRQLARGRREGFYRSYAGEIDDVRPGPFGSVVLRFTPEGDKGPIELAASFVIDATGLQAEIDQHPVLADLLAHGVAQRNPLGRLDMARSFELRGARSGPGRIYAAGAATLGCYLAGVDTFLGLQYAALQAADDLASLGYCDRIGVRRSMAQWVRWMGGRQP
ncbi:MAG: hypothetical protein ACRDY2_11585 [Acidimicrobiales bacterium]